jgi:hypothetical protein
MKGSEVVDHSHTILSRPLGKLGDSDMVVPIYRSRREHWDRGFWVTMVTCEWCQPELHLLCLTMERASWTWPWGLWTMCVTSLIHSKLSHQWMVTSIIQLSLNVVLCYASLNLEVGVGFVSENSSCSHPPCENDVPKTHACIYFPSWEWNMIRCFCDD